MSNAVINKLFKGLNLPKSDRTELDRILNRPEVQAVINADEIDRVSERKILIQELKGLPAQFTKAKALAEGVAHDAVRRFDLAEAEFYAAKAARHTAWLAAGGLDQQMLGRETAIKRELASGADHRIADYRFELDNLLGRVRVKMQYWVDYEGPDWRGQTKTIERSNTDDVVSATTQLENSVTALNDLQLSAITHTEVTQSLQGLSDRLKAPLAKLKMHPPTLDKFDNVKAPQADGSDVVREMD